MFQLASRPVLSFRYFAEATFHFQFFQTLIFRGARTNTSVLHAAQVTVLTNYYKLSLSNIFNGFLVK